MELTVLEEGRRIGVCSVEEMGLYWSIVCRCQRRSDRVERLYCGMRSLGVLEWDGETLSLNRRLSKASVPEFPPPDGILTLTPPWQGNIWDCPLPPGQQMEGKIWYPASEASAFPCMPLFCFFCLEERQGRRYWTIPKEAEKNIQKSY